MPSRWIAAGVCAIAVLFASPALADARVLVRVSSPGGAVVDGVVSLSSKGDSKKRFQCRTRGGRCTINRVPGGTYYVVFRPGTGKPTSARKVVIPPKGDVQLRVAAK